MNLKHHHVPLIDLIISKMRPHTLCAELSPCSTSYKVAVLSRKALRSPRCPNHVRQTWQQSRLFFASAQRSVDKASEFQYLKLELPTPKNCKVKKSVFVKSSAKVADCPPNRYPEFAVIGRSNVGKSSLINCLTDNDRLAKVSKQPGMTKLINHYLINDSWYLVDLPGYGFAKTAGKEARNEWIEFTKDFFINRDNLVHVFLLLDSSIPPQQIDADCANWLAECEVPFSIVFTKLDAKKKDKPSPAQNIVALKRMLAQDWEALPMCFETSSKTGQGKSELQQFLASLRELHNQSRAARTEDDDDD